MSDLLNEYGELIHEPVDVFEFKSERADDGTPIYVEDDTIFSYKIVVARRRLIFRKEQREAAQILQVSMATTDGTLRDVGPVTYYETHMKKALDAAQVTKMREMAEDGWWYSPPMFEMGIPDPRSHSDTKVTEIKL